MRGAVQLVGAVRWQSEYVVAGLAMDSADRTATGFWTSGDGKAWEAVPDPAHVFAGTDVSRLLVGPKGLVAFGTDRAAAANCSGASCPAAFPVVEWTSRDGRNWQRDSGSVAFDGATIVGVASGPEGLIAVGVRPSGTSGRSGAPLMWQSSNGIAWTRASLGDVFSQATFSDIAASVGTYVVAGRVGGGQQPAVGPPGNSRAAGWWSTDGRTWQPATVAAAEQRGATLGTLRAGQGGLVALGSDMPHPGKSTFEWTSHDGRTWQPAGPNGASLPGPDIRSDGTHLVAIGPGAGDSLLAWSSLDGQSWRALTLTGSAHAGSTHAGSTGAGSAGTIPAAPGAHAPDEAIAAWFAVPGGLIAAGQPQGVPPAVEVPIWFAAAMQS